jgi:hypothetical protein
MKFAFVGRGPRPAADATSALFGEPDRGSGAGEGARPTSTHVRVRFWSVP